ncbi:MAG: VWA domain-containing protein [Terriglobales bacterium]
MSQQPASAASSQPDPPATVPTVSLIAVLNDRKGHPAPDASITKDELQVEDAGKVAQVLEVRRADAVPLRFALVLDLSRSGLPSRQAYVQFALAVVDLLRRTLRSGLDHAVVVGFRAEVSTAWPLDPDQLSRQLENADFSGGTALHDALVFACRDLAAAGVGEARRILLVISDGEDTASKHTLEEVKRQALRGRVAIYSVNLEWDHTPHGTRTLRELATTTGGRAFKPYNMKDLLHIVDELANDLRSHHLLVFRVAEPRLAGEMHKVKISLGKGSKLQIRAPAAYYRPPN